MRWLYHLLSMVLIPEPKPMSEPTMTLPDGTVLREGDHALTRGGRVLGPLHWVPANRSYRWLVGNRLFNENGEYHHEATFWKGDREVSIFDDYDRTEARHVPSEFDIIGKGDPNESNKVVRLSASPTVRALRRYAQTGNPVHFPAEEAAVLADRLDRMDQALERIRW